MKFIYFCENFLTMETDENKLTRKPTKQTKKTRKIKNYHKIYTTKQKFLEKQPCKVCNRNDKAVRYRYFAGKIWCCSYCSDTFFKYHKGIYIVFIINNNIYKKKIFLMKF